MGELSDRFDDANYQLMMDIQAGRMVNTPRPAGGWMLLGLVTFVLGGFAGFLLASGNYMRAITSWPQAAVSTAKECTPQPLLGEPQNLLHASRRSRLSEADAPLAYQPPQELGSADIKRSSDREASRRTKSLSPSPTSTYAPRPESTPLTRVSKLKRESDRMEKARSQKVRRRQAPQLPVRSFASDFDPNADLVRSSP